MIDKSDFELELNESQERSLKGLRIAEISLASLFRVDQPLEETIKWLFDGFSEYFVYFKVNIPLASSSELALVADEDVFSMASEHLTPILHYSDEAFWLSTALHFNGFREVLPSFNPTDKSVCFVEHLKVDNNWIRTLVFQRTLEDLLIHEDS